MSHSTSWSVDDHHDNQNHNQPPASQSSFASANSKTPPVTPSANISPSVTLTPSSLPDTTNNTVVTGASSRSERKKGHKKNRSDNFAKQSARIIEKWGNISPKKKKQKDKEIRGGVEDAGGGNLLQASVVPDLVKGEVRGSSTTVHLTSLDVAFA
jgi:hypothetical protein